MSWKTPRAEIRPRPLYRSCCDAINANRSSRAPVGGASQPAGVQSGVGVGPSFELRPRSPRVLTRMVLKPALSCSGARNYDHVWLGRNCKRKHAVLNSELIELAKLSQASFFNRRSMEWQLLLGFWAGMGLGTSAALTGSVILRGATLGVLIGAIVLLLVVVVVFCIVPIQRSHAMDKALFLYYTGQIEGISLVRPTRETVKCDRLWTVGQILFSVLLTTIACVLVVNRSTGSP